MATKLPCGTWRRPTQIGPKSQFRKSVKLPLSQADTEEIAAAYQKAALAAKESASSLNDLAEMLDQKIASIDTASQRELQEQFNLAGSGLFKVKITRCKLKNSGFEGRELEAFQVATAHKLQ